MSSDAQKVERPARIVVPPALTGAFCVLTLAGAAVFTVALSRGDALRAWQAYLVNFLFWTGMALGAVTFVAVLNITGGRWGTPAKRLGEAFAAFLPAGFLLFVGLYAGCAVLYRWADHPVAGKEMWLSPGFFFLRNGFGLLLLMVLAMLNVVFSLRGDRVDARGEEGGGAERHARSEHFFRWQLRLSPPIVIVFALAVSLMGFDLVMSLDARWYSTLFGGYFFIGSFYSGIAAVYLLALLLARHPAYEGLLGRRQFKDLGTLMLGFALFTGYLFYAQFLVIWYGNVSEEARYVILRVKLTPWEPLAWAVLFMVFLVPFFVLLSRAIKSKRAPMILLCAMVLAGIWLERYLLVAPSIWGRSPPSFGLVELGVTAGFLGLVALCVTAFLKRVPALPLSDPLFQEFIGQQDGASTEGGPPVTSKGGVRR